MEGGGRVSAPVTEGGGRGERVCSGSDGGRGERVRSGNDGGRGESFCFGSGGKTVLPV